MKTINFQLEPEDNLRLNNLCGQLDENLRFIERHLAVEINHRGHLFKIFGPEYATDLTRKFIEECYMADQAIDVTELNVALQAIVNQNKRNEETEINTVIHTPKMSIKPRGANQQRYIKRIQNNDINFGIGPAGTGKTYLAVACAAAALEQEQVRRIVLVRPAVEAGENLGFLPGDLSQKVDPYLRPMYDALYELMGIERVNKLIEHKIIEIAPLAFMRGRTLNDAFIILDESQNTTIEQMKMFLTRIGFNSIAVITGDITQVDLPRGKTSGLRHVIDVLGNVDDISFTMFDSYDVVRHPLVQRVIEAYESFDEK